MSKYIGMIDLGSRVEALSAEDQYDLFKKAKAGDDEAKIKLFQSLKGLIIKEFMMKNGISARLQNEVLVACYIGFEEALKRFDPEFKTKFSTYAFHWLRLEFFGWLKEQTLVRLPERRICLMTKLENYLSKIPGNEQWPWNINHKGVVAFCREDGCSQKVVENILQSHRASGLNNTSSGRKSLQRDLIDTISPSSLSMLPERENVFVLNRNKALRRAMNRVLTSRQKEIFRLRFGLDGEKQHTQTEIGLKLGLVSKQAIDQSEKRGLRRIEDFLEKNHPEFCCAT